MTVSGGGKSARVVLPYTVKKHPPVTKQAKAPRAKPHMPPVVVKVVKP